MKYSFALMTALALTAFSGCEQGTPGGPGADAKAPAYGQAEDTFNLSVPLMASSLQQGEEAKVAIGIKRAKNFDEDVALHFTDLPKGVTAEPAKPLIKHGDSDTQVTLKAAEGAGLGDFSVKVTGHPAKGADAHVDLKLALTPKDTFTLGVPLLATSLKQGTTQTVSIAVSRQKNFDQDVTLKFGELPEGVTLEPKSSVVKQGDANAQIMLTAADDAALGNFTVKIVGHPTKGPEASSELKLTVVK